MQPQPQLKDAPFQCFNTTSGSKGQGTSSSSPAHLLPSVSYTDKTPHKLVDVKRGIFHPKLPSLKRMALDDHNGRMDWEHSRHSTYCTMEDFDLATTLTFPPPLKHLASLDITSTGQQLGQHFTKPSDVAKAKAAWNSYMLRDCEGDKDRLGERLSFLYADTDPHTKWEYDGVSVRQRRPEVQQCRFTLTQEPRLTRTPQMTSQQPTPALADARHRPRLALPHMQSHYDTPYISMKHKPRARPSTLYRPE